MFICQNIDVSIQPNHTGLPFLLLCGNFSWMSVLYYILCISDTHVRYNMKYPKATKPQLLHVQPLVLWPTLSSSLINKASVFFFLTRSQMINDINMHDIFQWHLVITPLSLPLERENFKMLFIEVNHIQNTSQVVDPCDFMALNSWSSEQLN